MKKLFLLLVIVISVLSASAQNFDIGRRFDTQRDSVSYIIGLYMGHETIKFYRDALGNDFSNQVFMDGVETSIGDDYKYPEVAVMSYLEYYFYTILPEKKKIEGNEFLASIESQRGVQRSSTGLLYRIDKKGNNTRAKDDSNVEMKYKGTKINGEIFDQQGYEGMPPTQLSLNNIIPGFAEGLKLIGEGGKVTLWIPAELSYGAQGPDPYMPLIFEIELITIE